MPPLAELNNLSKWALRLSCCAIPSSHDPLLDNFLLGLITGVSVTLLLAGAWAGCDFFIFFKQFNS